MNRTEMHQVVLELGLEDLIPLWEVAQTCGVAGVNALTDAEDRADRLDLLVTTLLDLLHSRRIRIFVGPWQSNDPTEVTGVQADALLRDSRRYIVEQEAAEDLDRVYYVNVENLPH